MKMAGFWVIAPYCLVKGYRIFRDACCLHLRGDEKMANFYQIARRSNPEEFSSPSPP
jgi:hypothetical protein